MFRGLVSIDVQGGVSIDVGWVWAVDGRVVSVEAEEVKTATTTILSMTTMPWWDQRMTTYDTTWMPDIAVQWTDETARREEADISDPTSTSIDTTISSSIDPSTSETIDTKTYASIIITTSLSIDSTSSASIDADSYSTQKRTDISSYYPSPIVEKEITIEDFLELEEFLELEDGENLGDLDSSREVIMEDFLELEECLDSEQKLNDERNTKRKDLETSSKTSIDRQQRYIVELEQVEERMYISKASHLVVLKHQRPPTWTKEAAGFHKRVKTIHDPGKIVVPCDVFEAESPIPPDKGIQLSSYSGVFDDHICVEASQRRGLRFRGEFDNGPIEADIAESTLKSIDISSCDHSSDGDREITMEDFLELEEFLELEDGEKLGDLVSSREVTMEDFLELEEWLDSEQKLDVERNTTGKDLETSSRATINRHKPDEID
ncbi:hypothetical protein F2Q70_00039287 [Brassica cretica]|uniref:Uncharacterized protein n=1 Tax=Brassica cretica TaxID=69181 RepID=A0A8S9K0W1_BRACR|nr:hypothetical protein F2Q70_00039287 [Brassica cretica]